MPRTRRRTRSCSRSTRVHQSPNSSVTRANRLVVRYRVWTHANLQNARMQVRLENIRHQMLGEPGVARTRVHLFPHFVYALTQHIRRPGQSFITTGCGYMYDEGSQFFRECATIANDVRTAMGTAGHGLFMTSVSVHPDWRSRGKSHANALRLGQRLTRAITHYARRYTPKYAFVYLTVETNNPGGIRCYKRAGFHKLPHTYAIRETYSTRQAYAMWCPLRTKISAI